MDNKKKLVLKLAIHDDKGKQKALKAVSGLPGIESIAMDMKDKKMTITGDEMDPIVIVAKLRKMCHTDILTVGPAKEPEKKNEPKKDEGKKEDGKKDEDKKKADEKHIQDLVNAYKNYNPHMTQYYCVHSIEENPNACVIC